MRNSRYGGIIACNGLLTLLVCCIGISPAFAQNAADSGNRLAPYVPSPMVVVEKMLELAQVTERDIVYDLGCGDGRIVIEAAKRYGAHGVGVELDSGRVQLARENVEKAGVGHLVTILHQDALTVDISRATVVAVYLLPQAMQKLRPIFEKSLAAGTRIVSHDYSVDGWTPVHVELLNHDDWTESTIYFWILKKPMR